MFPRSKLEQKPTPVLHYTQSIWYKDTTKLSVKLYYHTQNITPEIRICSYLRPFAQSPSDNPLAHEIWNFVEYLQQTSFV